MQERLVHPVCKCPICGGDVSLRNVDEEIMRVYTMACYNCNIHLGIYLEPVTTNNIEDEEK